jgi:hypothetical protein
MHEYPDFVPSDLSYTLIASANTSSQRQPCPIGRQSMVGAFAQNERKLGRLQAAGLLPSTAVAAPSLSLQEESVFVVGFRTRQQFVSGLLAESLEILDRAKVGRNNAQHLAALHVSQRFFCAQYRQRAIQTARIQIFIEIHFRFLFVVD